jgi:hypothetical protein
LLHRGTNSAWLIRIESSWFSSVYLAEIASSGALASANEECRFSIFPAFKNVRAAGFLTHGVELFFFNKTLQFLILGAHFGGGSDPLWFSLDGNLAVTNFKSEQLSLWFSF